MLHGRCQNLRMSRTCLNFKRYEDALDALVCTWVGVEHLEVNTVPLGDETAAIWCPRDVVSTAKSFRI